MTAKERLRELVDGLDDGQAEDVLALVEKRLDSPLARALAAAPLDDESRLRPRRTRRRGRPGASTSAARRSPPSRPRPNCSGKTYRATSSLPGLGETTPPRPARARAGPYGSRSVCERPFRGRCPQARRRRVAASGGRLARPFSTGSRSRGSSPCCGCSLAGGRTVTDVARVVAGDTRRYAGWRPSVV